MCVDVACVRASEVCWFGFEGGLLRAAWVLVLEGSGVYVCLCGFAAFEFVF